MPEVREDLTPLMPTTGADIRFAGFGVPHNGGYAVVQFEVIDEEGDLIGTVGLPVPPQKSGTIDAMVAAAHHHMKDIVRQWLHRIDQMAGVYDKRQ